MDKAEAGYSGNSNAGAPSVQELERMRTAGGHIDERGQPSLPVVHRRFANPSPLGLLSFATGTKAHNYLSEYC